MESFDTNTYKHNWQLLLNSYIGACAQLPLTPHTPTHLRPPPPLSLSLSLEFSYTPTHGNTNLSREPRCRILVFKKDIVPINTIVYSILTGRPTMMNFMHHSMQQYLARCIV